MISIRHDARGPVFDCRRVHFAISLSAVLLSPCMVWAAQPDGASPKDTLRAYLHALKEDDPASMEATLDARNAAESATCHAYVAMLAAERRLAKDVSATFHTPEDQLPDELSLVSDGTLDGLAAAIDSGQEQRRDDKSVLSLKFAGQTVPLAFVRAGAQWKFDLMDYFHWKQRPSDAAAPAMTNRYEKEQQLVAQIDQDVRSGKERTVGPVVDRLMVGLAAIEQPASPTTQPVDGH